MVKHDEQDQQLQVEMLFWAASLNVVGLCVQPARL